MSELLAYLTASLAEQRSKLDAAQKTMREIAAAIEAINHMSPAATAPRKKRGEVQRAVLDCVREGMRTVAQIHDGLERKGLHTSRQAVSNTIQRLQEKKVLQGNRRGGWILASGPMTIDQNDESPTALTEGPSHKNGAAVSAA